MLRPEQYDSALSPQSDDTFTLHQQQDAAGNHCFSRQLITSYAYGISPCALLIWFHKPVCKHHTSVAKNQVRPVAQLLKLCLFNLWLISIHAAHKRGGDTIVTGGDTVANQILRIQSMNDICETQSCFQRETLKSEDNVRWCSEVHVWNIRNTMKSWKQA